MKDKNNDLLICIIFIVLITVGCLILFPRKVDTQKSDEEKWFEHSKRERKEITENFYEPEYKRGGEYYFDKGSTIDIQCYTKESVEVNKHWEVAKNIKAGDIIVCEVGYEVYSTDKIKELTYTLNYEGLILEDKDLTDEITIEDNVYKFNFLNPSSVGEFIETYTFRVEDDTNVYISLENINFTTNKGRSYKDRDTKLEF